MESEGRGKRQVDLFNFSFLDILACVIGLLIFILTIVVISGGGPSSHKKTTAVQQLEHHIADARASAAVVHERRLRLERLLAQRAGQAIDPVSAAQNMQKEAELFDQETQTLRRATERVEARLSETQAALTEAKRSVAVNVPQIAALDSQAREANQQADQALAETADARNAAAKKQNVQYYVPRVRETQRTAQVWTEISGDRIWFLKSGDYDLKLLDDGSTRYERRATAAGTAVARFVAGDMPVPSALADRTAADTLVTIGLRPDGFATFREFREWARRQGFAINWVALSSDEPIVLTHASRIMEQ